MIKAKREENACFCMFCSSKAYFFFPRWCWLHRRLSVYPCVHADTHMHLPCSSHAFISLGLVCLHFCSSSLFRFFCLLRRLFSLCPFCSAPGESSSPVQNFLSVWSDSPSVLLHPQATLHLSSQPFYMPSNFFPRLKSAPCSIGQSALKPVVLLLEDNYQTLPLKLKIPLIRTCY